VTAAEPVSTIASVVDPTFVVLVEPAVWIARIHATVAVAFLLQ
jgi:hypothetical protein